MKASKLTASTTVQILHMDDYFPDEEPNVRTSQPTILGEVLEEIAEECDLDLSKPKDLSKAVEYFTQGSGDGDENFALLTIVNGRIEAVTA